MPFSSVVSGHDTVVGAGLCQVCAAEWEFNNCGIHSVGGVALLALRTAEVALEGCSVGGKRGPGGGASYNGVVAINNSSASLQVRFFVLL